MHVSSHAIPVAHATALKLPLAHFVQPPKALPPQLARYSPHTAALARLAVCLAPCILIAPRVAGKAFTLRARWLVLANVAVGAFPGLVA